MRSFALITIICAVFATDGNSQIQVSIPNIAAEIGEYIEIPVNVDDLTGKDVIAFQSVVEYDDDMLEFIEIVENGTISQPWGNIMVNSSEPGLMKFGKYATNPLASSGALVKLRFRVKHQVPAYENDEPKRTSQVQIQSFDFNDGTSITNTTYDGQFDIAGAAIYPNTPELRFNVLHGCANAAQQIKKIKVGNIGSVALNWQAQGLTESGESWISLSNATGSDDDEVSITLVNQPENLLVGEHQGSIQIDDPNAANSPYTVPVILEVEAPDITIVNPDPTDPPYSSGLVRGHTYLLEWSSNICANQVTISYEANGEWKDIYRNRINNHQCEWRVANSIPSLCNLKVADTEDEAIFNINQYTVINNPVRVSVDEIVFTARSGGHAPAKTIDIDGVSRWHAEEKPEVPWLELNQNIGTSEEDLSVSLTIAGETHYAGEYKSVIRITDDDYPEEYYDVAIKLKITDKFIVIVNPVDNAVFETGSTQKIDWISENFNGDVLVEHGVAETNTWESIATVPAADGSIDWTLPDVPIDNCKIRVTSIGDTLVAENEGTFSMLPISLAQLMSSLHPWMIIGWLVRHDKLNGYLLTIVMV